MGLTALRSALTPTNGRAIVLWYLAVGAAANLAWEIVQLPLYTIWRTGSPGALAFAIAHCTVGDLLILTTVLLLALVAVGDAAWPSRGYGRVAVVTTILGAVFTVLSEWLNVEIWRSWAYAPAMPRLPPLGTGLAPLLQWLAIPPLALALARLAATRGGRD